MNPKVSVITPVYNLQDIVLETVHSVLRQTFTDLELIVADDGSTDRSAELIAAIDDPRLKLVRGTHSGLPAVGRNRAFEHARGEFIAIADADDVWLPDAPLGERTIRHTRGGRQPNDLRPVAC